MTAFWIVCSRLESLSMERVQLHLELPHPPPPRRNKSATSRKNHTDDSSVNMASAVRFPRLKNLMLGRMLEPHPLYQIDLLISQCPALRTLMWILQRNHRFPIQAFTDRLVSSTWPDLDSIWMYDFPVCVTDDQFRGILLASKQPLRKLVVHRYSMTPKTYDIYRTRHFCALESVDLSCGSEGTSERIIEILTLCPNLHQLKAFALHAEDILNNNEPWICHHLQEMVVFIDMGFPNQGPYRRFTEEEIDKCRAVFKRLAMLKELQVLDMLSAYPHTSSIYGTLPALEDHLVPLPLRLKAGLDILKGLRKLRKVGFWAGRHEMPMKELSWMVQHWKRLEELNGGWVVMSKPVGGVPNKCIWKGEQTAWLKERHISTEGSRYQLYQEWDDEVNDCEDCEDCCGLSDVDGEAVGSRS